MYYLICYDVSENKMRTQIMKLLKNEGFHLQKSVFIVQGNAQKAQRIYDSIYQLISVKTDALFMTPLCQHCVKKMFISSQFKFNDDVWII